jgi:hypothetical protein
VAVVADRGLPVCMITKVALLKKGLDEIPIVEALLRCYEFQGMKARDLQTTKNTNAFFWPLCLPLQSL